MIAKLLAWSIRLCVVLLVGLNVVLVMQNRSLKEGGGMKPAATTKNPVVGQVMTRLAGVDLEGRFAELRPADGMGIVAFAFSPSCPYSRANYQYWTEISKTLISSQWKVVWVTAAPLSLVRKYVTQFPIHDRVLVEVPYRTHMDLGLDVVPATAVITKEGKVEKVWYGGLQPDDWTHLRDYVRDRVVNNLVRKEN